MNRDPGRLPRLLEASSLRLTLNRWIAAPRLNEVTI